MSPRARQFDVLASLRRVWARASPAQRMLYLLVPDRLDRSPPECQSGHMQHALLKTVVAGTFRVFISFSTKDLAIAQRVQAVVEAARATVFFAPETIKAGDSLNATVLAAIRDCDLFVVLCSSNAAGSEWVRHEVREASGFKKRIVPFVLDSKASVPDFLSDIKYIAAYDGVDQGMSELVTRVASLHKEKKDAAADKQSDAMILLVLAVLALGALGSKKG